MTDEELWHLGQSMHTENTQLPVIIKDSDKIYAGIVVSVFRKVRSGEVHCVVEDGATGLHIQNGTQVIKVG